MNDVQIAFNRQFNEFVSETTKLMKLVDTNNIDMDSIDKYDVGNFARAVDLLRQANNILADYRINAE